MLPNLTAQQQSILEATLQNENAYSLDLNSLAFRAQGIETTVESGIGKNIFLRGGYTYLDSVVQHSFSSDNQALLGGYAPTFDGHPCRHLLTAQRRASLPPPAPHRLFHRQLRGQKFTGVFTSAFASRSDDSTFLGYEDLQQGNSLVLPNRNLDFGFAKLDLGGSYQLLSLARDLRPGGEPAQPAAHRADRLSQPAHELPHRLAHPVGTGKPSLTQLHARAQATAEPDSTYPGTTEFKSTRPSEPGPHG